MSTALEICQRNAEAARARMPIADPAPDHFRDAITERRNAALLIVGGKPEWFRKDFAEYLGDNFHVYLEFERKADTLWNRGFRHYGHRGIWEVVRFETAVREVPNELDLKLNDHFTKDVARLYISLHPDRDGLFEFRNGQSAVRAA